MTRPYNWKPGMRELVAERMRKRNADRDARKKRRLGASQRMKRIHALAFEAECYGLEPQQ